MEYDPADIIQIELQPCYCIDSGFPFGSLCIVKIKGEEWQSSVKHVSRCYNGKYKVDIFRCWNGVSLSYETKVFDEDEVEILFHGSNLQYSQFVQELELLGKCEENCLMCFLDMHDLK